MDEHLFQKFRCHQPTGSSGSGRSATNSETDMSETQYTGPSDSRMSTTSSVSSSNVTATMRTRSPLGKRWVWPFRYGEGGTGLASFVTNARDIFLLLSRVRAWMAKPDWETTICRL
ncbi:MAG: hypothetical protein E6P95_02660 [Candidatus Moraniibacteriota bacterium]|nr:MAG: hypothetical protein E6P95_02660 [Candidatus Moranbacteria bacterium]